MYQTNIETKSYVCLFKTFNGPDFTAKHNTDEQGTKDAFFNHRKRTTGDYYFNDY